MMKVCLVWYFTVIANCFFIKYAEANTVAYGNPKANTVTTYDYVKMRKDSRKLETFRNVVRKNTRRQRYGEFMADMINKHSKAVALTISLAATVTIVMITVIVAVTAILQCSLCYDQFIPDSVVL